MTTAVHVFPLNGWRGFFDVQNEVNQKRIVPIMQYINEGGNTMREKKYFGKSRTDVLAKVRKECGENFYIIQVKKVTRRHFLGFADESFEVVVAIPEFFLTPDVH